MASKIKAINQQDDQTWNLLYRRILANPIQFQDALSRNLYQFLNAKSTSTGTCIGYFFPTVMTTISFLLARNRSSIQLTSSHSQIPSLFTVMIGPPGTGKSPTIKSALTSQLKDLGDLHELVISNITSSGLSKLLSEKGSTYICNAEIYKYLNKLLTRDEVNSSGDIQFLSKLWSGEQCDFHYASESTRIIPEGSALCIIGW